MREICGSSLRQAAGFFIGPPAGYTRTELFFLNGSARVVIFMAAEKSCYRAAALIGRLKFDDF
jgi:hypothetical protein